MSKYLKSLNIRHYYALNETKSGYCERVIRTLKMRLNKIMLFNQDLVWLPHLQDVTYAYNNATHRILGQKPSAISSQNEDESRLRQYVNTKGATFIQKLKTQNAAADARPSTSDIKPSTPSTTQHSTDAQTPTHRPKRKKSYKFKKGDTVRISRLTHVFHKEHDERWSNELFRVAGRMTRTDNIQVYKLVDFKGDPVLGTFYAAELNAAREPSDGVYMIEKLLRKKRVKGVMHQEVKWRGWPSKYNTLEPLANIRRLKDLQQQQKTHPQTNPNHG